MADPPKPRPVQSPASPPRLERAPPQAPVVVPGPSRGLDAPEVTAEAALAASIAQQGDLAAESGLRLFALAAATGASGRLTLAPEGSACLLTFRKGVLEHVVSSGPGDDLAAFLVARGVVQAAQVAEAATVAGPEGDLVGAMVTLRLVNGADLVRFIQEHAGQLVTRVLGAEAGSWSWEPGVAPPPSAFPLGSPWVMLGTAVRALDSAAVVRRLGPREELGASVIAGRVRVEDLRLGPAEARVASTFDGSRLSEVARLRGADAATVLRVALLLAEVGLLSFAPPRPRVAPAAPPGSDPATPPGPDPAAPPGPTLVTPPLPEPPVTPVTPASPVSPAPSPAPPPAAASRGPPPETPRPPGAAPRAQAPAPRPIVPTPVPAQRSASHVPARPAPALDERSLRALLDSYAGADHFKVLGVSAEAAPAQIKVAYFQLAKAYHPDTVAVDASPVVKKLCADLFSRIGEAWGVLGDEARRARYVEDLATGAGVTVDVMGILQAESLFQAGTLMVKARQYEEAAGKFSEAMKLNPEEVEYGMWLAWCGFVAAPERKKVHARAVGVIEAGLKKSPRCMVGYLFLGQMAKIVGDLALAEKQLKRGLAIAPDHVDLQRELKYLRK